MILIVRWEKVQMKFKVGIVDTDKLYLERIVQWFSNGYSDKLEIFSFTNEKSFEEALQNIQFDMVLVSNGISISREMIPLKTGFAYLVSQNDIDMIGDIPVIRKFQSAEMLYKQMVGLYASNENIHVIKKNTRGNLCKVITITSASGGVGTSTIAVSSAKYFARQNKKVLLLNFEKNESQTVFMGKGDMQTSFSDVIYLLKSNKSNIALRMESLIQKDASGIFYFNSCRNILDRMEMDAECIKSLVEEVCMFGDYDYVVIDSEFNFDESSFFLAEYSDSVIVVADGTQIGCSKLKRFFKTLQIVDTQKEMHILPKFSLIYNRFSSKTGQQEPDVTFPIMGGTPKYESISEKEISEQIAKLPFWEKCQ